MLFVQPGIYCIENKINNKKYIGSSKYVQSRLKDHMQLFLKNEAINKYLRFSLLKYGKENFNFYIIELLSEYNEDTLRQKEKYYIDFYKTKNSEFGYNKQDPDNTDCPRRSKIQFSQSQTISILNMYNDKISLKNIGKIFNVSGAVIERILKENNVHKRNLQEASGKFFTDEQEKEIIFSYLNLKESPYTIGKRYNVYGGPISKILRKHKIKLRNRSEAHLKNIIGDNK